MLEYFYFQEPMGYVKGHLRAILPLAKCPLIQVSFARHKSPI